MGEELVEKVKAAAGSRGRRALPLQEPEQPAPIAVPRRADRVRIIVLGISTGGPQGLRQVLQQFPADCPVPIAMVMHMPVGYTAHYAARLSELCSVRVVEAQQGDVIAPGTAYLAPAGRHMTFRQAGPDVVADLSLRPLDTPHRPSVDVLFQSAAEMYGGGVLAAVMTGMGADGREGAAWIKARGGCVLAEAEETCVVYGMPRAVVEAGLADAVVPLDRMAAALMERI
jgi:two-component system, chemotaxis family, protein-glutamate methylesterase/glutaminase